MRNIARANPAVTPLRRRPLSYRNDESNAMNWPIAIVLILAVAAAAIGVNLT